jgi:integrase
MGNYAGVDWASAKHDVVVQDEAGEELLAASFAHDEKGLRSLCRTLVRMKVTLVAIERPDGLLTPHCLRHSYLTHLAELGWAAKFIQDQVGHSHAATTAVYMSVGDDFKDRLVRAAIDEQLIQLRRTQ